MKNKTLLMDICLISAFLTVSLVLFLVNRSSAKAGSWAVVAVNGVETERYSLSSNGTFPLNGGSNVLVIEEGSAFLSEADCPDRLCVKQGRIKYTGQCITCLPNKLTVTIEGGDSSVDFVI